ACDQDARVDWVTNQVVGAAGHQFRVVLLRHRGAPVAPDVRAGPDREPQSQGEEDEPDGSAPGIGVEAVAPKCPQANQEAYDDNDDTPDPHPGAPRNAALLGRKACPEPVQPERRPSDGED